MTAQDLLSQTAPVARGVKAPNEKLTETLFTHYALRILGDSGVTVYTPSTREEYTKGYDAALMGVSAFDELYLQFKAPDLLKRGGFSFGTRAHQHDRLQRYPRNTAFYVTHTFEIFAQIQQAQRDAAEDPNSFLRRYLAIEIKRLEPDVTRFRYQAEAPDYVPWDVNYKLRSDDGRTPTNPVAGGSGWMTGDDLLRRYCAGVLGARVVLVGEDLAAAEGLPRLLSAAGDREIWAMNADKADHLAGDDHEAEWGTALRKALSPLPAGTAR